MTGRTYLVLGACAGVPLSLIVGGHLALPLCVAAGALGGLLPDIDHPQSALGQCVPWPCASVVNNRGGFVVYGRRWFGGHILWHRHETHSIGTAGIVALGTFGSLWWPVLALLRRVGVRGDLPPSAAPLWVTAGVLAGTAALAVLAGYLRHLAAGLVNVSPQMLWWPFSRRLVRIPGWHGVREGRSADCWFELAAVVAALAATWYLWVPRPL